MYKFSVTVCVIAFKSTREKATSKAPLKVDLCGSGFDPYTVSGIIMTLGAAKVNCNVLLTVFALLAPRVLCAGLLVHCLLLCV